MFAQLENVVPPQIVLLVSETCWHMMETTLSAYSLTLRVNFKQFSKLFCQVKKFRLNTLPYLTNIYCQMNRKISDPTLLEINSLPVGWYGSSAVHPQH